MMLALSVSVTVRPAREEQITDGEGKHMQIVAVLRGRAQECHEVGENHHDQLPPRRHGRDGREEWRERLVLHQSCPHDLPGVALQELPHVHEVARLILAQLGHVVVRDLVPLADPPLGAVEEHSLAAGAVDALYA